MMRLLAWVVLILVGLGGPALADTRVALVIGNARYDNVVTLENPAHDATAVADLLRQSGFDTVELASDLKLQAFRRKLSDFELLASRADIAVVYYSGHGIEVGGQNYLVPTDAALARDIDVDDETVPLDRVLKAVAGARRLKLVILDACRNNPFVPAMQHASSTRAVGTRGLARIEPDLPNTLVAYAARAGTFASDGEGTDSPFTAALLRHIAEPNLDVRLALGRVRDEVVAATRNSPNPQEPFVYGSLGGAELPLVTRPGPPAPDRESPSEIAWSMVRDATSTAPLFRFVDLYPTSPHRSEALKRAAELERQEAPERLEAPVAVSPTPPPAASAPSLSPVATPAPMPASVAPAPTTPAVVTPITLPTTPTPAPAVLLPATAAPVATPPAPARPLVAAPAAPAASPAKVLAAPARPVVRPPATALRRAPPPPRVAPVVVARPEPPRRTRVPVVEAPPRRAPVAAREVARAPRRPERAEETIVYEPVRRRPRPPIDREDVTTEPPRAAPSEPAPSATPDLLGGGLFGILGGGGGPRLGFGR